MEKLSFLKTKKFSRPYSITTNVVLILSIVFNFFGFPGDLFIQNIAGLLFILGVILLVGQILLVLNFVNKSDKIGWILNRLAYITMLVVILGMFSIIVGSLVASFYLLGGVSLQANVLYSSIGMTGLACFGIILSWFCHHTNSIENVWNF